MKITILCVGKIKERYWTEAIGEYSKRLSRYCDLQIIEETDEAAPPKASSAREEQIRRTEGQRLLRHLRPTDLVAALAIEGKRMDSPQLAEALTQWLVQGDGHVVFVIGGSLGLSREVLSRAQIRLSFSDLTFPHQLMRVILLEQIYRCFRIVRHEPYHK